MCGIYGSPQFTDSIRGMLPHLGVAMMSRGMHSWGASDGYDLVRHVGPLYNTWATEWEKIRQWDAGIFHTRHASVGEANALENAHPHIALRADGTGIVGIHNGTLSNHIELNRVHNRQCTVDSQHIWMHLAEGKPLTDLRGSANLAWWEISPTGERLLSAARINSAALNIVRLADGGIVFCSELQPLRIAAGMSGTRVEAVYTIEEFQRYHLHPDIVRSAGEILKFGVTPAASWRTHEGFTGYTGGSGYGSSTNRYSPASEWCTRCASRKEFKMDFFCKGCLNGRVADFLKWKGTPVATPDESPTDTEDDEAALIAALNAECGADTGYGTEFGFYSTRGIN